MPDWIRGILIIIAAVYMVGFAVHWIATSRYFVTEAIERSRQGKIIEAEAVIDQIFNESFLQALAWVWFAIQRSSPRKI